MSRRPFPGGSSLRRPGNRGPPPGRGMPPRPRPPGPSTSKPMNELDDLQRTIDIVFTKIVPPSVSLTSVKSSISKTSSSASIFKSNYNFQADGETQKWLDVSGMFEELKLLPRRSLMFQRRPSLTRAPTRGPGISRGTNFSPNRRGLRLPPPRR